MELTPFTLDEALEICEDFEDLKDTEFKLDTSAEYLVHDVVVCPFAAQEKQAFINGYYEARDNDSEQVAYTGDTCDVIVLAYDVTNETDLIHMGIRAFAHENGIVYSLP